MTKRIVLCADDYGQAPAISQGIVRLIEQGRLSATSCMTNMPLWAEHAKWLEPHQTQIDMGLHFNLTEGKALSKAYQTTYGTTFFSLSTLMRLAFLRQLDESVIASECAAQLESFAMVLGRLPDFIDGHQHIHQFPQIRTALMQVYQQHFPTRSAYIRLSLPTLNFTDYFKDYKKVIIRYTGANALKALLDKNKISYNHSFSGIYDFNSSTNYARLFPNFLQQLDDGGLIMCHPGLADFKGQDSIAKARYDEYQYFAGGQFLTDCGAKDAVISRFLLTSK